MKIESLHGKDYRLPDRLNQFQRKLYIHLIDWKWANITVDPGNTESRGTQIQYDAILPTEMINDLQIIYPPMIEEFRRHRKENHFRLHSHFNHMASSQAANVNLFLPILHHPLGSKVLALLKPDIDSLALDHLDQGYCLEFWGGNFRPDKSGKGPLGDKSGSHGTDSDIAIAYRNIAGELCLWLIEHKLTENEFTPCSGPQSNHRDIARHDCCKTFAEILNNKQTCFHHDYGKRRYWDITDNNRSLFVNRANHTECPFREGMNQLWRNLLLAMAMEQDEQHQYKHAAFSVVKHPANSHLDATLSAFKKLLDYNPKFTVFTSEDVLRAAETFQDDSLNRWTSWYRNLYML